MKSLKTIFITLALFLMSFSFVSFVSAAGSYNSFPEACPAAVKMKIDAKNCVQDGTEKCADGTTTPTISGANAVENCSCVCMTGGTENIVTNKSTITAVIGNAIKVILGLSGLVALVFIIWGGVQIMFSQGKPEAMKEAKGRLTSGAIGILIIALAYGLADFVLNALKTVSGGK